MTNLIIGVDEVGRGPWAGPVTASAVLLNPVRPIVGLDDSKKLSERRRDFLAPIIRDAALAWSVVHVEVEEIDAINILQATLLAMRRALLALVLPAEQLLFHRPAGPLVIAGDAAHYLGQSTNHVSAVAAGRPDARAIAQLVAEGRAMRAPRPLYLRGADVTFPAGKSPPAAT